MSDFQAWMSARQARVETVLFGVLPGAVHAPRHLHDAMRYAVLGGGKRVRPLLAFAAGELSQADPARVEQAAIAVELIHAYSLVHDDMPCMDNDVLRRGLRSAGAARTDRRCRHPGPHAEYACDGFRFARHGRRPGH
jgi:farnesyl diphosphate synthase